jgi:glyoxylase-like metal-dependent hydrolase (beta-lactamase superfamily II)
VSGRVLPFTGSQEPWSGGRATDVATCVLAPNASPWTLDGTNTWIIGDRDVVIVDPGPDDNVHLAAVSARVESQDQRVVGVLLTHGHLDHSAGARALAEQLGVGVRALDPGHRLGDEGLVDGDVIDLGTTAMLVVATPGHSGDSVCVTVPSDGSVLTGDTVLGRGTTLVAWPDGTLRDYLDSLGRLRDLAVDLGLVRILPGHGPVLGDPVGVIDAYLSHRRERLAQVREVYESGITSPEAIVEVVYADVPREVWPAAEQTVRAQVDYLRSVR